MKLIAEDCRLTTVSMIVWNEFKNDARVLKEAETLQAAGYDVTVHALHTPGVTSESEVLESGVRVNRTARSPFWKVRKRTRKQSNSTKNVIVKTGQLSTSRQVLRLIARLWTHLGLLISMVKARPQLIHAHDVNVLPTAWAASKLCRVPLVYDAHEISTDREGYAAFRGIVARIESYLMPRVAGCITTTDARAKFFARAYHIARPIVLQNRPRYLPLIQSNYIRETLGLTESWPIILYQGGLQQGRGLAALINVAKNIESAYFVFIGGGRLEGSLKAQAKNLDLEARVHFISTVSLSDLPKYTASADIGVQPIENTCLNHFTTDSNKLFEYVIAGLPVVAARMPEIAKVINTYDLGLMFDAGDSAGLEQALSQLVYSEALRLKYRSNARAAAKALNWERQEQDLLHLYERITLAEPVSQ